MGRKKGQKSARQTLISAHERDENAEEKEEEEGEKGSRFFACYLLTSLCPRFKGHTYIGYTVNPRRRIRQHNGEIGCGAWRTKKKRPWEMVLCIYGFPTNVAALQFEWAWQHPVESLAVRKAAATFKSLSGLANKIKLAYTMLTLPPWQSMNLTVNLFSTKYQKHTSGCPPLPGQMRTQVGPMDDLPCYNTDMFLNDDCDEEECDDIINSTFSRPTEENVKEQQINHSNGPSVDSTGFFAETQPINEEFTIIDGSPSTSFPFSNPLCIVQVVDKPVSAQHVTSFVAEKDPCLIKSWSFVVDEEVEVIDLFTPSPCYKLNSCSKKRRRTRDQSPEVIDLTNSPLFV